MTQWVETSLRVPWLHPIQPLSASHLGHQGEGLKANGVDNSAGQLSQAVFTPTPASPGPGRNGRRAASLPLSPLLLPLSLFLPLPAPPPCSLPLPSSLHLCSGEQTQASGLLGQGSTTEPHHQPSFFLLEITVGSGNHTGQVLPQRQELPGSDLRDSGQCPGVAWCLTLGAVLGTQRPAGLWAGLQGSVLCESPDGDPRATVWSLGPVGEHMGSGPAVPMLAASGTCSVPC